VERVAVAPRPRQGAQSGSATRPRPWRRGEALRVCSGGRPPSSLLAKLKWGAVKKIAAAHFVSSPVVQAMGAAASAGLALSDVEELQKETGFSAKEIQRLYRRFERLDKDGAGSISTDEFLSIPELAMNPLAMRVISLFGSYSGRKDSPNDTSTARSESGGTTDMSGSSTDHSSTHTSDENSSATFDEAIEADEVNFRQFCKTLSVFRPNASEEEKLWFAFRIYDIRGDGNITEEELMQVLMMLVGDNLSKDQLRTIVEKTMVEADQDDSGVITFEEFKRCMTNSEVSARLSIRFS
jgi:Ca2+-binding EF-hand superfamily protein